MHKKIENLSIEQMREIVSKAPTNAESYQGGYYFRESPQFMFHNGFHDQWNLTDNDGLYFRAAGFHPIRIDDLRTAIAEHDREFKVGDLVVYHSLPHKRLFKVHNKGGDSIVIRECWDEAGARCFAENSPYVDIRHATPEEIKAGHRLEAERHG